MSSIVAFFEMERLFIYVCHFLCLVFHIAHGTSGRDDSYSWAIAHEDGVELEVDDHGDLEDAAAVLVFSDELLAVMKGFGLDILTLFSGCPELDDAWSVVDILAHSYDIVKELLAINLGFSRNGSSIGSMDNILSRAKLYRTRSFFTEPKRNHLFLYSFSR